MLPVVLFTIGIHLSIFIMLVCLHLDVEIGDTRHQRRDVLICLPELLFVLSVLGFKMVQLTHAIDFDSLILLNQILYSVCKFYSISLNLIHFIFEMSLDF